MSNTQKTNLEMIQQSTKVVCVMANDAIKCMDGMKRTPEELKKGLECDDCKSCPYNEHNNDGDYRCGEVDGDALSYIQQLEAERDAAVSAIPRVCGFCKWYGGKHGGFLSDCKNPNGCRNISGINTGWQWRGVQKEDGNEAT